MRPAGMGRTVREARAEDVVTAQAIQVVAPRKMRSQRPREALRRRRPLSARLRQLTPTAPLWLWYALGRRRPLPRWWNPRARSGSTRGATSAARVETSCLGLVSWRAGKSC